ncbi:MAG: efflux RND transporter permease subunit [Akkermansia sp.]
MSEFFIKRPIVAICISIMLVLLGAFTIFRLPVAEYPNIIPPVIQVSASYPGADCDTVVKSIASPIEQQMSGVDGMAYMSSVSTNEGQMSLSIVFDVGTDANIDQVLAYLRYGQANSQLPAEVNNLGVSLRKTSGPPTIVLGLYSPKRSYDGLWLANYAYINLVNDLKRVKGVGDVQVFGAGSYAMRIWLNPEKLSALNITVDEVLSAIKTQNTVNPAGKVGAQPAPANQQFSYTVKAPGRLVTAADFEKIVIRGEGGALVRLRDVARVELGAQTYNLSSSVNGNPAASIGIYEAPDSNALDMADAVKKLMSEAPLPPDMSYLISLDSTKSVRAGITDIAQTLLIALVLVIFVVFIFLQGWRGTVIPACAIPVAIIGAFIAFPLFGFSINTICLMGMVLAIGLVVDDAIVVVEAVQNHIQEGMSPRDASLLAMKEVSGPIVSTALVISCVFLPTLLLPGVTGLLFEQFAITIGCSILISAFCALSLSPALSAMVLRKESPESHRVLGPLYRGFNALFEKFRQFYVKVCGGLIKRIGLSVLLLGIMTILIIPLAKNLPVGFLPNEDQGYLFAGVELPLNTSLNETEKASHKIEQLISSIEGVETVTTVNGFNLMTYVQSSSNAFFFISLTPWEDRTAPGMTAKDICARINQELAQQNHAGVPYAVEPPPLPGVGTSGDVSFLLEDRQGQGEAYLTTNTASFIKAASQMPEIASIRNFMSPSVLQYKLDIDTDKAALQGVDTANVYLTLQAYMGSVFVNYFNIFGQQWQVYMQADKEARSKIDDLDLFYVRAENGKAVPIDALVTVGETWAPEFMMRQNMFNCSMLDVVPADGYSSGQVMRALEKTFAMMMPSGMGFAYSGMSFQEQQSAKGLSPILIFGVSMVLVFLILASLYESWALPVAVLLTVPVAILGAFAALAAYGLELNVYSEIGLIVMIALAAKNAILIVEFAVLEMKRGKPLLEATLSAARIRLRPILMTSFAFIFGCLPLAFASGAGATARQVVGITVIGGMITAVFIGIFLIPSFFFLIAKWSGRAESTEQDKAR